MNIVLNDIDVIMFIYFYGPKDRHKVFHTQVFGSSNMYLYTFFMSVLLCFIGHILLSENTFFNNIIGCIVNCIFKGFMWKIIRCKYSVRKSSTRFYYLLCSILSGLLLYAYNYQNTKEVFQGSHLNLMTILFQ